LDSVVKPLGITVKKEAGKVDETSGERYVDKPHATKEFGKRGNSPGRLKMTPKWDPKKFLNFQILKMRNILKMKYHLWHGASVDVGKDFFIYLII